MNFKLSYLWFFFLCVLICSCAGLRKSVKGPVLTVLETTPSTPRPDWAKPDKDSWVETGIYYSVGYMERAEDLQTSVDAAQTEAQMKLAEQIKTALKSDFQKYMEMQKYEPKTGEYVNKLFEEISENTLIPSFTKNESYTEKIKETIKKKQSIFYRSYVLLGLGKSSYEKLFKKTLTDLKNKVKTNKDAKKLVKEIENIFLFSLGK